MIRRSHLVKSRNAFDRRERWISLRHPVVGGAECVNGSEIGRFGSAEDCDGALNAVVGGSAVVAAPGQSLRQAVKRVGRIRDVDADSCYARVTRAEIECARMYIKIVNSLRAVDAVDVVDDTA